MDDLALAADLVSRHPDAGRRLVELHYDALYRFLHQLTGDRDEAQDLAQQTLIRLVRTIHRYDGRVRMRAWIYAFAVREVGRWRRRRLWLPLPANVAVGEDLAGRTADAELLLSAIQKLSDSHRAAFLLHYVEGLSIEEIADIQRTQVGTVKSRLHYARAHLRTLLEEEEFYVTQTCQL